MISHAPRHVPTLDALLSDLGRPSAAVLGDLLDVHPRTVQRWIANGRAPRPVALALFWMSSWGRSEIATRAHNDAALYSSLVAALRADLDAARREIARLCALGQFGSANDPSADHRPQSHSLPVHWRSIQARSAGN